MEGKIKNTLRCYYKPNRMAKMKKTTVSSAHCKDVKQPSYTIGGSVNWHNHFGKQFV